MRENTLPEGFKRVGVSMPRSVVSIIKAAGGENNMPYAMASIIGCLPHIAIALRQELADDEYAAFVTAMIANLRVVVDIVTAPDPKAAFNAEYAREYAAAKKGTN